MRRLGALVLGVTALLVAGAVPASASKVVILETKAGGVAQPGAPARLVFDLEAELGTPCWGEISGSIAVNGKAKDSVTFPGEVSGGCAESNTDTLSGGVSAFEPTLKSLILRSSITYGGAPPCLYQFPPKANVEEVDTPPTVILRRISGPNKECPRTDYTYVENLRLIDPQNGEQYEEELAQVRRAR
jgi:hypothetical protein